MTWRAQAIAASGFQAFAARQPVAEFALQQRLPSAFLGREFVEAGGLLSYAPAQSDPATQPLRIVDYVDRVLRGTPPAELAVEQPSRYELVVNMKTAKALGLNLPPSVLARVDEIIQ